MVLSDVGKSSDTEGHTGEGAPAPGRPLLAEAACLTGAGSESALAPEGTGPTGLRCASS